MFALSTVGPFFTIMTVLGDSVVITEPFWLASLRTRNESPSVLATFAKPVIFGVEGAGCAAFFVVDELVVLAVVALEAFEIDGLAEPAMPEMKSRLIHPVPLGPCTLYHELPSLSLPGPASMLTVWPS